jgi:hypothetical protein
MTHFTENENHFILTSPNKHRPAFIQTVRLRKNPQQIVENQIIFQAIKC